MSLIVQKFGGTSLGDLERINRVADRVARTVAEGHRTVVVAAAAYASGPFLFFKFSFIF